MAGYLGVIKPVRAFERAILQIAEGIQMGDIVEGDRLPSERDLAAIMEISRPSLRSAVRVFEDAGVLEVRPGSAGGIFVVTTCIPLHLLDAPDHLTADDVRGAFEARRLLEPRVAHLAAVYATQEDFDRMQRTIDAQTALLSTDQGDALAGLMTAQDVNFHLRLANATHNVSLVEMIRPLIVKLARVRASVPCSDEQYRQMIRHHEATLAAIMAVDHDAIAAVMNGHIAALEVAWQTSHGVQLVRPLPDFMVPGRVTR